MRHRASCRFSRTGVGGAGLPGRLGSLEFELTLAGDVDPGDSFGVAHTCADSVEEPTCAFIEDYTLFCSADEEVRTDWGIPVCQAGTPP